MPLMDLKTIYYFSIRNQNLKLLFPSKSFFNRNLSSQYYPTLVKVQGSVHFHYEDIIQVSQLNFWFSLMTKLCSALLCLILISHSAQESNEEHEGRDIEM